MVESRRQFRKLAITGSARSLFVEGLLCRNRDLEKSNALLNLHVHGCNSNADQATYIFKANVGRACMCAQVMVYPCCPTWRTVGVMVWYVYECGQVLGYQYCSVEY